MTLDWEPSLSIWEPNCTVRCKSVVTEGKSEKTQVELAQLTQGIVFDMVKKIKVFSIFDQREPEVMMDFYYYGLSCAVHYCVKDADLTAWLNTEFSEQSLIAAETHTHLLVNSCGISSSEMFIKMN